MSGHRSRPDLRARPADLDQRPCCAMLKPVVRDPDGIRAHAPGALVTQEDHSNLGTSAASTISHGARR